MTLYTAPNDRWPAQFTGTHTPLLWANVSKLRGGQWTNTTPKDVAFLAQSAKDGNPAYPTWNGPISIQAGTAVCLDTDTFFETHADIAAWQPWTTDRVAELYAAFKEASPHIPLTGYAIPTWPVSDYMLPPYIGLKAYQQDRAARRLELINAHLDFVCIRCPLFPGDIVQGYKWIDAAIDFMPHAVDTVRRSDPSKQVFMWLRDDFNGNAPAETYQRYARAAMVDSHCDGVVLWGDSTTQIPKLLAACQQFIPATTRPPVRNATRPATRGAMQ